MWTPLRRRTDNKIVQLGGLGLFRRCSQRDLRLLASVTDDVAFAPGEFLCHEGRWAYECFVIASGEVEVTVQGERVALLGPGEVVGEMALIDGGARAASVAARTDVHVLVIDRRRFDDLLERAPAIGREMLMQLSGRLRRVDDELVGVRRKPV